MIIKKRIKKFSKNNCYSIEDLKKSNTHFVTHGLKDKESISILFIDDEGYSIESIKSLGYLNVEKKYNHVNMKDYEKYDVIFCDINDVAKDIYPKYQGAALATEIKKTYPEKTVVIFSSKNQNLNFGQFFNKVDFVIEKNVDFISVVSIIDSHISRMNDPIDNWLYLKKQMNNSNFSSITIAELEHYYVGSLLKKENFFEANKDRLLAICSDIFVNIVSYFITKYIGG